ncbi:hypothetical protein ACN47E_006463 [Coniothyrium glycines]
MTVPPLSSPPFIPLPHIHNLRSASHSLTTTSSPPQSIRPGILYRSADLSALTPSEWHTLSTLGITTIFDLRSGPEVSKGFAALRPDGDAAAAQRAWEDDVRAAGLQRHWVPVFEDKDYSPARLAERYVKYMDEDVRGFVGAYREILRDGGAAYRAILLHLARGGGGGSGGGILVHCTAGKDRTGLLFALLFAFLGVAPARIADEYHLSEHGLLRVRDDVVARLLQSPGFNKYMAALRDGRALRSGEIAQGLAGGSGEGRVEGGDAAAEEEERMPAEVLEKGRQAALRMVGARRETMVASLAMLEEEFGGAERYMREYCGLGDGELEALKRNLLVPV